SKNIARSLLKEPKIYFFDVGLVDGDAGAKFENLVAFCLWKHCCAKLDYEAKPYALHYLHTKEKHEVDFAIVHRDSIEQIIEAKHADASIHSSLRYFHKKYQFPAVQVVQELRQQRIDNGIAVIAGKNYLESLAL